MSILRLKSLLVGLALLLNSMTLLSESILYIPEQFDVLKVNDTSFEFSSDVSRKVELIKGTNKIQLQYSDFFDVMGNDFEKVESRTFYIVVEAEDEYYYLLKAEKPLELESAREYANNPKYDIVRHLKETLESTAESTAEPTIEQLKASWSKASAKEKILFMKWIKQNK